MTDTQKLSDAEVVRSCLRYHVHPEDDAAHDGLAALSRMEARITELEAEADSCVLQDHTYHSNRRKLADAKARIEQLTEALRQAVPFVAKAYREGGIPTFPNAGDWLDRAAALTEEDR